MNLEQLKDLLSTYGVNDQERNAPVLVTIGDQEYAITEGEVDWTMRDGNTVRLQAVEAMTCDKCGSIIPEPFAIGAGRHHVRGCPRYDCGCDWDSRARNPKGCTHGTMSVRQLANHPHPCSGPCAALAGDYAKLTRTGASLPRPST